MKIVRESRKHTSRHGEPVILFAVGDYCFAASANQVEEIRDLHGLQSVSSATLRTSVSKVKFTLERSSKTYLVVDACQYFRQLPSKPTRLMVLRSQPVAVLVDSIDRMAEMNQVLPLPKAFTGDECRWYGGLALMGDTVVPVVNLAAILTATEQVVAKSVIARLASKGVSV